MRTHLWFHCEADLGQQHTVLERDALKYLLIQGMHSTLYYQNAFTRHDCERQTTLSRVHW